MKIDDMIEKSAVVDNDKIEISNSAATNDSEITRRISFSTIWTWIKSKLFNSSSIKLKNYARVVVIPNAFTNGVDNERVNIKIPCGDGLNCQIKAKCSANFSYGNTMGILEKTYNLGSNGSAFWLNINSYSQVDGAISYWISFGDIYSENGYFIIPVIKRNQYTDALNLTVMLEFEGLSIPSDAMIDGICSGGVYISSEPIPSENRLGTKGYNVLDSGHMGAGSGLDADKLQGLSPTDFSIEKGEVNAEFINNPTIPYPYTASISHVESPNTGLPSNWYHIQYFTNGDSNIIPRNSNGYSYQIAVSLTNVNTTKDRPLRYERMSIAGVWGVWNQVPYANGDVQTSLNAEKWNGNKFPDFLDQPVRKADQPEFQQLTLSYPADSDFEAVRGDKEITISVSSDNNAILVNGTTERVRKLSQSIAFILSLVQSDLVLGANTNGCNINNGSSVLLGDTNVSIDFPQRIDQESDFNTRSLRVGGVDSCCPFGSISNGIDTHVRNIGEQAMCSGNVPFTPINSGKVEANTNNVHMEGALLIPNDDHFTLELIPSIMQSTELPITLVNFINFNYDVSERLKHISYELNIVVDFLNGHGLYDSCTINFYGMIIMDNSPLVKHTYKQGYTFSVNFMDNNFVTESLFRSVELLIDFGSTPGELKLFPRLRISNVDTTSLDWFDTYHTSQTPIGDGSGYLISSWKWEFNSIHTDEAITFMTKAKK